MKFNFQKKKIELTDIELVEDKIVEELILKLDQPEKWLNSGWATFEFCDNELILEWKNEKHEKKITAPALLVIPRRWHSVIQKKLDIIENFWEASKNRFLLSYLRGEYTIQVEIHGREKPEIQHWLLVNIKEDPYYFQGRIVWFKSEKIATFCKTALG